MTTSILVEARGSSHPKERRESMGKIGIRWLLAVSAVVLLSTSGHAADNRGNFCLELKSEILGINHEVSLNYTGVKNGYVLVYGKSCYTLTVPEGRSLRECVPVDGAGLIHEGEVPPGAPGTLERIPMLEIELHSAEHHALSENEIITTSSTHIWIQNLADLTGIWEAQSLTSVEDVTTGLFQSDEGTVKGVSCPPATDEEKELEKLLNETLKSLEQL
jgi:hypothetical protein